MLIFHIIIMVTAVFMLFIAGITGQANKLTYRDKIRIHKSVAVPGVLLIVAGFLMLLATGGLNTRIPHFYLAVISIIFLLWLPVSGIKTLKAQEPERKTRLRKYHIRLALFSVILIILTLILGIIQVLKT